VTTVAVANLEVGQLDPGYFADDLNPVHIANALERGRRAPKDFSIGEAITGIRIRDTIYGSSELVVTLHDPDWDLLDSGVFDANENGRLDPKELNYPDGSKQWWSLSQVELADAQGGGVTITLHWIERPAQRMLDKHGPRKTSRGAMTRAEFIWSLAAEADPKLRFNSRQLTKKQDVAKLTKEERKVTKEPGLKTNTGLTVQGNEMSTNQVKEANAILAEGEDLGASPKALLAAICAAIGESDLGDTTVGNGAYQPNSLGFWGVLQGRSGQNPKWPEKWFPDPHDTRKFANAFFTGKYGFHFGAIALAKDHPDWTAGKIATTVEGSGEAPSYYDDFRTEARKIVEEYGGASSGTVDTYTEQYNFEVGSTSMPHEKFWDAMQRLAKEVRWALFLDENTLYYDAETTLIRQEPASFIRRGNDAVLRVTANWDQRHIATQCELELVTAPLTFRAGEVIVLRDYGPLSTGSRVGLPGRWLIEEIDRDLYSPSDTITLKQPQRQAPEPRSKTASRQRDVEEAGSLKNFKAKQIIDELVLPLAEQNGMDYGINAKDVETRNALHDTKTGFGDNVSDHTGMNGNRWAADMGQNGIEYPTEEKAQLAQDIADLFGIPWRKGQGSNSIEKSGWRIQLIYDGDAAFARAQPKLHADHQNHVHCGVKQVGPISNEWPGPQPVN
jgi:hypothetical protein